MEPITIPLLPISCRRIRGVIAHERAMIQLIENFYSEITGGVIYGAKDIVITTVGIWISYALLWVLYALIAVTLGFVHHPIVDNLLVALAVVGIADTIIWSHVLGAIRFTLCIREEA